LLLWSLDGWSEMSTDLIVGQLTNSVPVYSNCYGLQSSWHTKLISFTFCVCFTFQHQLWVCYLLCIIGVRNWGFLLILRKRPSVLRALLLHNSTWSCKISGLKTANKHLDWRLRFSMGHKPETGDTKKGTCFFPRIKFWLYTMSMILLLLHWVQGRILKVSRLIQLHCSIIDTP
jgi:hypothetical protein